MIRNLGILSVLCFSALALQAQENQYAVKITGDTIYGKIMINPVRDNSNSMFFKSADGSRSNLSPLRYNYVYYNPKYQFRSVPLYNRKFFMQVIHEAHKLSLYNYVHQRDNNIVTSKVMYKSSGDAIELSALNFKNQMNTFMDDCPDIIARLATKEFRYKNHESLVAAYNQCEPYQEAASPATAQNQETPSPGLIATPAIERPNNLLQNKLNMLQSFREYTAGLTNFQFKEDVLELLIDIENRIRQQSEIPSYLWTSLDAMVEDHGELKMKVQKLKLELK